MALDKRLQKIEKRLKQGQFAKECDWKKLAKEELYNLMLDPQERENLSEETEHQAVKEEMEKILPGAFYILKKGWKKFILIKIGTYDYT